VEEKDVRVRPLRVSKRGIAAVVVLFAVTLFAAQTCQQSQVRVTQDRAVATARERAGFVPERTQIRLVRQGLTGHPFWAVSLSVPARSGDGYDKLTTVRIDANTGEVAAVNRER
jgi:hypothetical protein